MPKATLWPHIVDLDQVERAAALIARFGGAYGRLFYPLFQLRKCRPTPNLRGPVPKSAHQGEILADRRCDPLRTSLDRYEPGSWASVCYMVAVLLFAVWWRLRIEDELRHQDNEDNDE